jgi:HSP20 family protein
MLMRFDPFREFDRLTEQVWAGRAPMPIDAYRRDDEFVVDVDLPGVDPDSIDLTVEQNVLTVRAERTWTRDEGTEVVAAERPHGTFTRQMFLGEALDTDHIDATYDKGVLSLRLPVAEHAKPRKVAISAGDSARQIEATATSN